MNKVLDSREPTLSTGSLWLPWVPSGSWEERSWQSPSPATLRVRELFHQVPVLCCWRTRHPRNKGHIKRWRKYSCTAVQGIMIIMFLKSPEQSRFRPNPQDRCHDKGFRTTGVLSVSISQLWCSAIMTRYPAGLKQLCKHEGVTAETSVEAPTVQESAGVLVNNEQLLLLYGSTERYKLS